jgi:hypothetical protein
MLVAPLGKRVSIVRIEELPGIFVSGLNPESDYFCRMSALLNSLMGGVGMVAPTAFNEYPLDCQ